VEGELAALDEVGPHGGGGGGVVGQGVLRGEECVQLGHQGASAQRAPTQLTQHARFGPLLSWDCTLTLVAWNLEPKPAGPPQLDVRARPEMPGH